MDAENLGGPGAPETPVDETPHDTAATNETVEPKRPGRTKGPKAPAAEMHLKSKQVKLTLKPKSQKLLGATALGTGQDWSTIVNELIETHLGDWVLSYRGA